MTQQSDEVEETVADSGDAQSYPYDESTPQEDPDQGPESGGLVSTFMSRRVSTQRDTDATIEWLRADRARGSRAWRGLCQMRVRSARNLPALYPSAFAAMVATPMSKRVDIKDATKGMIGYADDPNDSNKFGHVFTFVGRESGTGIPLVDTNDALIVGGGSVVRYDWFESHWGDRFQFASTTCNGFDLIIGGGTKPAPDKNPEPKPVPEIKAENFDYATHRLEKSLVWHEKHGFPGLARRIRREMRDLEALKQRSIERRQKRRDAER